VTATAEERAARRQFRELTVTRVDRLCDDAVAVTFAVPPELAGEFAFHPGQSLTLRRVVDGRDERRSYSICAPAGMPPRIGVREVPGGALSSWLVREVQPGDRIEVQPPSGSFTPDLSAPGRHVLIAAGFSGRLDADRLRRLLPALCDVAGVDHWWLCGPFGMVTDAMAVLAELDVPAERVHRELFYVEDLPPEQEHHEEKPLTGGAEATIVLDGRSTKATIPWDTPVLDAAQRVRPDLPFACKGGVCGTCRARLVSGEVRMRRNFALEPAEVAAGFVLTCQSLPVSEDLTVDYDT
jgi:ring-1,2-phenylacetyl-CoA epoxidase subunit PaaE